MTSKAPVQTDAAQTEPRAASRLFTVLADSRRRRIVSLLRERRDGIAESELATLVASAEAEVPLPAVTDEQYESALAGLHHNHLPSLESTGLVDRVGATVRPTDALADSPTVETILDVDAPPADVGTTLDLLASERRQFVIRYLRAEGAATVDDLVSAIGDAGDRRAVRISLRHTHLPKIAEAGAISDDEHGDERYVIYEGLPLDDATVDSLTPDRTAYTR